MYKLTMHQSLVTILLCAAILLFISPQATRAAIDLQSDAGLEGSETGPAPVPLPEPIDPPSVPGRTVNGRTFQLVGFTRAGIDGVQGVLNYTLACQKEFSRSRMCTIDEINETVSVPAAPGFGFAWVGDPTISEPANCRGWASPSPHKDSGMAIELSARYGAKVSRDCNQSLRIACCAAQSNPTSTCPVIAIGRKPVAS